MPPVNRYALVLVALLSAFCAPSFSQCQLTYNAFTVAPGCFPGSDIGAQITNAYNALPPNGGIIYLPPPPTGGCWSLMTGITFTTPGKYVILQGIGATGSLPGAANSGNGCLNYIPTSGVAITLDYVPVYGPNASPPGAGLRDIQLQNKNCNTPGGCGSSAIGVECGNTNWGCYRSEFFQDNIFGFATGFNILPGGVDSFGLHFTNTSLYYNGTGFNAPEGESQMFDGGYIANNGIGMALSQTEVYLHSVMFDDNKTVAISASSNANVFCFGCHFENLGQGTEDYVTASNFSSVFLYGGQMEEDHNTSSTYPFFIQLNNDATLFVEGTFLGTANKSGSPNLTQVIQSTSTTTRANFNFVNSNTTAFPTMIGFTSGASPYSDCGINTGTGGIRVCQIEDELLGPAGLVVGVSGHYKSQAANKDVAGTCTLDGSTGQCTPITFFTAAPNAYLNIPACTVTWTGAGTLTGILSSQVTISGLRPKSSVNSDTAVIAYICIGNPF